ncbi:sigma factor-like helix-turn-helix DNA-binding protein [Actinomadura scrupuli]|uniref:sigma factor-like helix-turn-helix DNA-binding protein n=1 Tax=Actinomadura scrupuli TaxID=559629 RepID=UPI003D966CAF
MTDTLATLSDRQQKATYLRHGLGWSLKEISEYLDISASTAGVHIYRGTIQLRAALTEYQQGLAIRTLRAVQTAAVLAVFAGIAWVNSWWLRLQSKHIPRPLRPLATAMQWAAHHLLTIPHTWGGWIGWIAVALAYGFYRLCRLLYRLYHQGG